jgi:hypothetical protein
MTSITYLKINMSTSYKHIITPLPSSWQEYTHLLASLIVKHAYVRVLSNFSCHYDSCLEGMNRQLLKNSQIQKKLDRNYMVAQNTYQVRVRSNKVLAPVCSLDVTPGLRRQTECESCTCQDQNSRTQRLHK